MQTMNIATTGKEIRKYSVPDMVFIVHYLAGFSSYEVFDRFLRDFDDR